MIVDCEETIAHAMCRIRAGDAGELELFDMVDGTVISDLRIRDDGLVGYSVHMVGTGASTAASLEERLRSGSLIVSGGPARAREPSSLRIDLDVLSRAAGGTRAPRASPRIEADALAKIAMLITAERGDPLDEAARDRLVSSDPSEVREVVFRLTRDANYRLDEFRHDAGPTP